MMMMCDDDDDGDGVLLHYLDIPLRHIACIAWTQV